VTGDSSFGKTILGPWNCNKVGKTFVLKHSCADRNEAFPVEKTELTVESSILVNSGGWMEEQVVSLSYLKNILFFIGSQN